MKRASAKLQTALDVANLPPAVRERIALLQSRSRGPRSGEEWAAFRQRMAEIDANLTIEDLPLTGEELAFFDLVFGLNVSEAEENALHDLWVDERARKAGLSLDAAE